jgi:5,10-methylenetetrahydromethanopterin reductase
MTLDLSCSLPPGHDTAELVAMAESLGYRRAWLHDSPALYHDAWMTLAVAATRTTDIGLGVAVTVPELRHPLVTASAVATLEDLAPGRVAVGVGTGFTARRMLGRRPAPWHEVRRFVLDLRSLLSGGAVQIDGALVQMRHAPGHAPPRPIATPLLVAASGPRGRAVAAEVGDGVIAMGEPCPGFGWSVFATAGTVLDPGETLASSRVAETLGAAVALVYHFTYETAPDALAHLPGGPAWRASIDAVPEPIRHLELHDGHGVAPNARELPFLRPELAATTLTGGHDELVARVCALRDGGVTELLYTPMGADIPRELRAMAAVVRACGP